MNNLDRVDTGAYLECEEIFEKVPSDEILPVEIFQKVFSYLNKTQKQKIALVNHFWFEVVTEQESRKHFSSINKFVDFLKTELLDHPEITLSDVKGMDEILESKNLQQLNSSIVACRENILIELKKLDDLSIEKLKNKCESFPVFFDNFFELLKCCKTIDKIHAIKDYPRKKDLEFYSLCVIVAQMYEFDKALEIANKVLDSFIKGLCLKNIQTHQIFQKQINKKLELVDDLDRDSKLEDIAMGLIKTSNFGKAEKVARMIKSPAIKQKISDNAQKENECVII